MPIALTSGQVRKALEREVFAVLATVNARGQPRTAAIVHTVKDRVLFIATGLTSFKARNVARNPHVSLTVTVEKRIPFLPWIKIPAATITFQGLADPHPAAREAAAQVPVLQRAPQGRRNGAGPGADLDNAPVRLVAHDHAARLAREPS